MAKITEIIPDDMPNWIQKATEEGRLFNAVASKVVELEKELEAMTARYRELWHLNKTMDKELKAKLKIKLYEAFQTGYEQGHHATVEGYYSPEEAADDYFDE